MLDFAGRVAIVTGAGRSIGRAYALMLAERNCRVVVNDLPGEDGPGVAHQVVAEIRSKGGQAIANEDSVIDGAAKLVNAAIAEFGQLDIVINNAGSVDHRPFEAMSPEDWKAQVDIHLFAAVDVCRHAWPHLQKSGTGRIVNTSSAAILGNPYVTPYASGKAGIMAFSRSLALEAAAHKINVNCIFPNAWSRLWEDLEPSLTKMLKTHCTPQRVAAFGVWLVHQDTTINGEMFDVVGGMAAPMNFAYYPYVRADNFEPEGWIGKQEQMFAGKNVTTPKGAIDVLTQQLHELDPGFELKIGGVVDESTR